MSMKPITPFRTLALAALLALGGCASSPPVAYYTLVQGPSNSSAPGRSGPQLLIDVSDVAVPPQADQPQIMVRGSSGEITAMYSDRWSSPLGDEMQSAISDGLVRALGAIDVQTVKPAANAAVWRVQVDVQRFDSMLGSQALIDATWRVRPVNFQAAALLCASRVTVKPRDASMQALVEAHQRAVAQLAATIGSAIASRGRQAEPASGDVTLRGCTDVGAG
jgi:uncharacterized lipoprotein YmbA